MRVHFRWLAMPKRSVSTTRSNPITRSSTHNHTIPAPQQLPPPTAPPSNRHSVWRHIPCLNSPRVPSLGAFGRRPQCLSHCPDRPSSETLHNCRDPVVLRERQLHPNKLTNPPAQAIFSSVPLP